MQLVEQGKLDLDRDVNDYLDFKIPPKFGKPITLRELMTHTGGFTETMKGSGTRHTSDLKPLGEYLKAHIPARIFPPGKMPAYSNYGCALAGYIVERVSGEPYETYIDRHIFQPLGMERSTFRQPVPASMQSDLATGYKPDGKTPWYFEPINPVPAGALSSTVADMAKFMIAHLQDGRLGSQEILKPETAELMHNSSFKVLAPLTGMSLGFMELDRNGHQILGHSGATAVFRTQLFIFPKDGVGVFMARNSPGMGQGEDMDDLLVKRFTDRYFPAPPLPTEPTVATAQAHARLMQGTYELTRRFDTSFLGALGLVGQGWFSPITVRANPDATITFSGFGPPKTYREIGPFLWRQVDGRDLLAAQVENGRVTAFRMNDMPAIIMFQPAPWWKGGWNGLAFMGSVLDLLLTVVLWPVAALARRRYGSGFSLEGREATAYRFVRLAALVDLGFLIGWFRFVVSGLHGRHIHHEFC